MLSSFRKGDDEAVIYDCQNTIKKEISFNKKLMKQFNKEMKRLEYLPGGYLKLKIRKKRDDYYLVFTDESGRHEKYLGQKDTNLKRDLQERQYLRKAIDRCERNIDCLETALVKYKGVLPDEICPTLGEAYQQQDNIKKIIFGQSSAKAWKAAKEKIKAQYPVYRPENLKHHIDEVTVVRTKSEAVIYEILTMMGLTFVYELPTMIGDKIVYPDFTIYDERTGKEIILEHMGFFVNEGYAEHNIQKIADYIKAGYVPNVNLLLTFEDIDGNIDVQGIHRVLDSWFVA